MLLVVGRETEILSSLPLRGSGAEFSRANKKPGELRSVRAAGEEINCFLKGKTPPEAEALPARPGTAFCSAASRAVSARVAPPPSSAAWVRSGGSRPAQASTRDNAPVQGGKKKGGEHLRTLTVAGRRCVWHRWVRGCSLARLFGLVCQRGPVAWGSRRGFGCRGRWRCGRSRRSR